MTDKQSFSVAKLGDALYEIYTRAWLELDFVWENRDDPPVQDVVKAIMNTASQFEVHNVLVAYGDGDHPVTVIMNRLDDERQVSYSMTRVGWIFNEHLTDGRFVPTAVNRNTKC